jgi:hypothetical protein
MDLKLEISPSEKKIQERIGKENWANLHKLTVANPSGYVCSGCGFVPSNGQVLRVHVLPYDETDFDITQRYAELQTSLLCDACHTLKHFDLAAVSGKIRLVNSDFTQKDLIAVCRHGNQAVNAYVKGNRKIEKRIFPLKKKPEDYLREISEDEKGFNPKIKVIFTDKFNWSNCR